VRTAGAEAHLPRQKTGRIAATERSTSSSVLDQFETRMYRRAPGGGAHPPRAIALPAAISRSVRSSEPKRPRQASGPGRSRASRSANEIVLDPRPGDRHSNRHHPRTDLPVHHHHQLLSLEHRPRSQPQPRPPAHRARARGARPESHPARPSARASSAFTQPRGSPRPERHHADRKTHQSPVTNPPEIAPSSPAATRKTEARPSSIPSPPGRRAGAQVDSAGFRR
jgi:hypothetical protein